MARVELQRVSKSFDAGKWVLKDVDLQVDDGEVLVLLGPNGSGKTTLLRMIAGLERVSAGAIRIDGETVTEWPPRRRNVAMVFQGCVLYPHLTVKQNLSFGLDDGGVWSRFRRWASQSTAQRSQAVCDRVRQTAQLLSVESLLERFPRQLSGGERQRVALGRALVRQPAVFLFDEPMSHVDPRRRAEWRRILSFVRHELSGAMLYVTHDHAEAWALGGRIAVLIDGCVQQVGTARELLDVPRNRVVAEFIGQPAMNFVEGVVTETAGGWQFASRYGGLAIPVDKARIVFANGRPETSIVLGFRPHVAALCGASGGHGSWRVVVRHVCPGVEKNLVQVGLTANESEVGEELVVSVSTNTEWRTNEVVNLSIEWEQAHWFDARTGVHLARR